MTEHDQAVEQFYSGAIRRITRTTAVLGIASASVVFAVFGTHAGFGFAVGCIIAWLNFRSLARAVESLATRIVDQGSKESGGLLIARFLFRYVLVAVAAYAIFKVSQASLIGLLAGLCVPVGAVGCEAVYEAYVALRRGL